METVYLFYDGYELRAVEGRIPKFIEFFRGHARRLWRYAKGKQVYTGFYVAFDNLVRSLETTGYHVRINDFEGANRHPSTPIGVAGYPSILKKVSSLINPKVFGPGDPGLPPETAEACKAYGLNRVIQPCQWFVDVYAPWCGDKMVVWPTGIDVDALTPNYSTTAEFDFLIYDKIRWNYDEVYGEVIEPLISILDSKGLSYKIIRYGAHTQKKFLDLVKKSRAFAFICEHETQGLACQEVMALGVPVFAWDEGVLCDPVLQAFVPPDFSVTSVPYWDDRCGIRFKTATMLEKFSDFLSDLEKFRPRDFVNSTLQLSLAAREYVGILAEVDGS